MSREAYYRAAARNIGVPSMWLDDATQDITIYVWKHGDSIRNVHSAAIDAVRKYGPHSRYGQDRTTDELPVWWGEGDLRGRDPHLLTEQMMDFDAAWEHVTPGQRAALIRAVNHTNHDAGGNRAWRGRRTLRRWCA